MKGLVVILRDVLVRIKPGLFELREDCFTSSTNTRLHEILTGALKK
jgi:hypothetical protein